jgi:carboxylesterase type B
MKTKYILIISFLLIFSFGYTAKSQGMQEADRLAIAVVSPFGVDNENAATTLENNLMQALTLNGLSAMESRFVLVPRVALLKKDVTATAPAKYVVEIEIALFIGDIYTGAIMGQSSFIVKGIGNNEGQAYIAAIRNVSARNSKVKNMIINGKDKIISYFDAEGDQILGRIKAFISKEDYKSAMIEALSIPRASADLYNKASELIATIPPEKKVVITPTIINNYYYQEPYRDRVSIFVN